MSYRGSYYDGYSSVRNVYFHGDRSSLLNRNLLYHPVKVYVPLLARLKRYYARP